MTAVYGPRITVHLDRYGADRSDQVPMVKWLVLHTSEQSGAEDPDDAEAIASYLTMPGDRPSSVKPSGFYGASYHAITETDRILPATEDHLVAFAAGGANRYGLHLVLPVRIRPRSETDTDANTSRARWLDAGSRPYIVRAAEWLVDKSRQHDVPLQRITADQMAAGLSGYCDHWTASRAFGKSTHTDVGPDFPWDVLEQDIANIIHPPAPTPPPEEDPMFGFTIEHVDDLIVDTRTDSPLAAGKPRTVPTPTLAGVGDVALNIQALDVGGVGWLEVNGRSVAALQPGRVTVEVSLPGSDALKVTSHGTACHVRIAARKVTRTGAIR